MTSRSSDICFPPVVDRSKSSSLSQANENDKYIKMYSQIFGCKEVRMSIGFGHGPEPEVDWSPDRTTYNPHLVSSEPLRSLKKRDVKEGSAENIRLQLSNPTASSLENLLSGTRWGGKLFLLYGETSRQVILSIFRALAASTSGIGIGNVNPVNVAVSAGNSREDLSSACAASVGPSDTTDRLIWKAHRR